MKTAKRKYTPNQAAAQVRHQILRKYRALEKEAVTSMDYKLIWRELGTYIEGQAKPSQVRRLAVLGDDD